MSDLQTEGLDASDAEVFGLQAEIAKLRAEVERLRKIADAAHVLCDSYKAPIRTGWERTDARDALFAVLYAEEGGEA